MMWCWCDASWGANMAEICRDLVRRVVGGSIRPFEQTYWCEGQWKWVECQWICDVRDHIYGNNYCQKIVINIFKMMTMMTMTTMMMTMTSDHHCCCPPLFLFTVRPTAAVGCNQMPQVGGANQSFIALAPPPTAGAFPPIMDCMFLTISRSWAWSHYVIIYMPYVIIYMPLCNYFRAHMSP